MGAITNVAPHTWSITEVGRTTTSDDVQRFTKAMLDKLHDSPKV
jgi:hypothetical protein